ncbi:hypothetical protein SRABI128_05567 [Microbacterium sp. Bi128]|nr:hypothetical protein SRABI128_05567 [Microbacterium sp. Bi128]
MTSAFVLGEDVDVSLEVGVRGDGTRLDDNLATLDIVALQTAEQEATVLAGPCFVELLVEHLDTGNRGLLDRADADDLDLGVDGEGSTLGAARNNGATAGDREDIFDRHQEGLVTVTYGVRNGLVDSSHEVLNGLDPDGVAFEGLQAGNANNRSLVAIEALRAEQLANFHFNEVEELFVVNHVSLVQRDQQVGNANLAGEQNVLAGLSHRAVSGGNHEDCTVHLSSAGDHVLDVVSVTRSVYVCVVALLGLVLNVGDVDGNAALTLFGSRVNRREVTLLVESRVLVVQHLGNGGRQRRLTVVNVTNGTDVNVRLSPLELCLCHRFLLERFQIDLPFGRACRGRNSSKSTWGALD